MSALVAVGDRTDTAGAEAARQHLTFVLGGETYAMPIAQIKEIIEYGGITAVPMMPAFIRGVINLRGAVVPVIDLACRFGGARSAAGRRSCIVIMELQRDGEAHVVGLIVDAVSAVVEIGMADIEPPPAFGSRIRSDFIHGMGKVGGRFVVILNVEHVLSLDDLAAIERVQEESAA